MICHRKVVPDKNKQTNLFCWEECSTTLFCKVVQVKFYVQVFGFLVVFCLFVCLFVFFLCVCVSFWFFVAVVVVVLLLLFF